MRGAVAVLGMVLLMLGSAMAASAQPADLSVTVSDTPDPVAAAGTITYTITVTNNGPSAATNVALVNAFPPDFSAQATGVSLAGWTCGVGFNAMQCTIPSLAAGATAVFNASASAWREAEQLAQGRSRTRVTFPARLRLSG